MASPPPAGTAGSMAGASPDLPAALTGFGAGIGIVLGSGLGALADRMQVEGAIPYHSVEGMPKATVAGHAGRFLLGTLAGRRLIVAQGRSHLYEGLSAGETTAGIRVLAAAGIHTLILTNAAGVLNPRMRPGEWMVATDQLNLTGTSPLIGSPRFVDMSNVYDEALRQHFLAAARELGITLFTGVYAGVLGPQYETPAEVRMLARLGADAVGMSTVLEAIQAAALGLRTAALSCLTNWAAGIAPGPLSHEDVLRAGDDAAGHLLALLQSVLPAVDRPDGKP